MRQAGRSLPEYRAVRERHGMFEIVRTPELAAEVTLQPVRRLGVDAAILFSDIVVPLVGIGIDLRLEAGTGPILAQPFRSADDLHRLRPLEPEADVPYVLETIRLLVKELDVPLIGFAGGPFTLASYLIEGGPSKTYARTKALMYGDPGTWAALLAALAGIAIASLRAQVAAGAAAVQVFDSWVGALTPADYRRYVLPASRRLFAGVADLGVPRIHFGVGTGELLELLAEAGAAAVGVDGRGAPGQGRGRPPTPELLADLRRRYDAIGGTSPLLERTRSQAAGVAEALGPGYLVELGMKHAPPFIEDGVAALAEVGVGRVVGLVLAPHYSRL